MDILWIILLAAVYIAIGFSAGVLFFYLRKKFEPPHANGKTARASHERGVQLMRDERTKALLLRFDGQNYSRPEQLSISQRRRLVEITDEIQSWLDSFPLQLPSGDLDAAGPSDWTRPIKVRSNGHGGGDLRRLTDNGRATNDASESIAGQINQILQNKLQQSDRAGMNVRLVEMPNQVVAVKIGPVKYDEISEVPDQEIRSLIREAVEEWERLSES